jgi:signal transduction histidine kinase
MNQNRSKRLQFEISSGLKRVLGRELIIDDEVAIFELVKNSFDANASSAYIYFDASSIWIIDDGTGMSYDDIISKWLYVAYSEKKQHQGFRGQIQNRHNYAGSKGIGRFSSDRLGQKIVLQTKERSSAGSVHKVEVDWDAFDRNDKDRFDKIPVHYSSVPTFIVPDCIPALENGGTVIEIQSPRMKWNREKLLSLKSSLTKLINPFGAETDGFKIFIFAPEEQLSDDNILSKHHDPENAKNLLINGEVKNFIFSDLQSKTTFINVYINEKENIIETYLIDRGELVYKIREKNPYNMLRNADFSCQIYYLNRSAKQTFALKMGVPSIQFGSVFLFRNGFRVFPVGEDNNDWFGINRRKQQGFARFLGSREIIGRVDVSGSDELFQEASSRNQGLIENQAVRELWKCFREHCLKRLEKYVVPVSWSDKAETDASDLSRLLTESGKAKVTEAVARLIDTEDVELLEYSHKLISLVNERSSQFEPTIVNLRYIAEKTKDKALLRRIDEAEKRFEDLKKIEFESRRIADQERKSKELALLKAKSAEVAMTAARVELLEEKKRSLFLQSVTSLDTETILNLHHQITIHSVDIKMTIENFLFQYSEKKSVDKDTIFSCLERITFLNTKIHTIARFATKANFRLDSDKIEADIGQYISDYIHQIENDYPISGLKVFFESRHPEFITSFKPIDISIVVDNFISNAKKARASYIRFSTSETPQRKNSITMVIEDDGNGAPSGIDFDRFFEKGFSRTDGAGLGLYHIRQVLGEMGGSVRLQESKKGRTVFVVEVTKSQKEVR